ncbi:hypothetical protein SAMN04488038_10451 [Solimonas aquatica]|uniref:Tetratricopeptide repeat-containing protein n=2 Tax=Solimonas aquatica TaxID=489703 RepID=A0A1H9DKE3_9GAMM|nr:hypothetical protein SAMN04488038_10451 [Solimonas aquatica]
MGQVLSETQYEVALRAAESAEVSASEKAEMLMEIAMGMQSRPRQLEDLQRAVELYRRALSLLDEGALLHARIQARLGTALQALPEGGRQALREACACYEAALPRLQAARLPAEEAELHLNHGLCLQGLAGQGVARIQDAIASYHRALRVFNREQYAQEYAILHNNLAVAYLAIPVSDERAPMREALAVQSFEEVLKVVNLIDHPSEYAMIQNNLGNALQYARSGHPLDNRLRALSAYDEALKVRNASDTPLEYANTLANKANVLRNLPQDPQQAESGRASALRSARKLYEEAGEIFARLSREDAVAVVEEALADIDTELGGAD